MTQLNTERRYDIDWLRILAFAVLILYHIGMYYVADWGWHIKSEQTAVWLQDLMMLTNPWRMSLLFFISAIALSLVQQRYSAWRLTKIRSARLLIPLFFGMFVLVTPQVYFEALSQDLISPGYLAFWRDYINPMTSLLVDHHTPIGLLTWNHLWFLPYLWVYSLLILVLSKPLNRLIQSAEFKRISPMAAFTFSVVALLIIWLLLRQRFPVTHALLNDWYNHGKYFLVFIFGYAFAANKHWWQFVIDKKYFSLLLACLGYLFLLADRHGLFAPLAQHFETSVSVRILYGLILIINHWAWIFCVVGFAGFWLNRPSPYLSRLNEAVMPCYVLHQTLIIVFAWWLKPLAITPGLEAMILLVMTASACYLGYQLIRRIALLRWLFGMKPLEIKPTPVPAPQPG